MIEETEYPAPGEIVLATVTKIIAQGAYVTLDEYDDIPGFLHTQEIAPGWIKAINRYVKRGEKKVLRVKKVNPRRGDIDLSLKQVSNEQRKKKHREIKRYEKGQTLLYSVRENAAVSDENLQDLEQVLYDHFDYIYDAFLHMARNDTRILEQADLPQDTVDAVRDVCGKMKLPTVEIRGVAEIICPKHDGVERIRSILSGLDSRYAGSRVMYLGAPKYRISIISGDFKVAEKTLKPLLAEIKKKTESEGGTFAFSREDSKKSWAL